MVDRDMPLEEFFRTRHADLTLWLVHMASTEVVADYASAEGRELLRQHFVYWWELEEKGALFGAGPVDFGTPDQAGFAILVAADRAAAEAMAEQEPFHLAGWRRNTVRPWMLNEGLAVPLARQLLGG